MDEILSDMAFLIFYGNHFSSSTRISMLSLIILVLVCSFSYCSSSSLASQFDSSNGDIDNKNLNDENENYYRLLFRPSSSEIDYLNTNENRRLLKARLFNLLLKAALIQEEDRPYRRDSIYVNRGQYIPQSFHAMRG